MAFYAEIPMSDARSALATMTRHLGLPEMDMVVLGEGNTSIRIDDERFLVKASGQAFLDATEESFVEVRFAPVLELLDADADADEERLQRMYREAKVDPDDGRRPSVETIFHAALLQLPGVEAVAHTHPTTVNGLACSRDWRTVFAGRCFPDEAVALGAESVLVGFAQPGVALARRLRDETAAYLERHGVAPRLVIMQNHGMVALGRSPEDCVDISMVADKSARIRAVAYRAGGLNAFALAEGGRLLERPDGE